MLPNAISPEGFTGRTLAYDCLTQKWFELASYTPAGELMGMWRALSYYNGLGGQLIGDSQSSQVGILDPMVFGEFGGPQLCEFTTQSMYASSLQVALDPVTKAKLAGHNRVCTRLIEVVITPGEGQSYTVAPTIDLLMSCNNGYTYESFQDPQSLGLPGQFDTRAQWFNLGQGRDLSFRFRITDPTPVFGVDIQGMFDIGGR
jgi:hypothetical protein